MHGSACTKLVTTLHNNKQLLKQNGTCTAMVEVWTADQSVWQVQLHRQNLSCWCSQHQLLRSCCPVATDPQGHVAIGHLIARPCSDADTEYVPQPWSVASVKSVQCASLEEQSNKFVASTAALVRTFSTHSATHSTDTQ